MKVRLSTCRFWGDSSHLLKRSQPAGISANPQRTLCGRHLRAYVKSFWAIEANEFAGKTYVKSHFFTPKASIGCSFPTKKPMCDCKRSLELEPCPVVLPFGPMDDMYLSHSFLVKFLSCKSKQPSSMGCRGLSWDIISRWMARARWVGRLFVPWWVGRCQQNPTNRYRWKWLKVRASHCYKWNMSHTWYYSHSHGLCHQGRWKVPRKLPSSHIRLESAASNIRCNLYGDFWKIGGTPKLAGWFIYGKIPT